MNSIYISNKQNKLEVTHLLRGMIRRVINFSLEYENFQVEAEVSVTLTDNKGIRALNRDFRNIDRETDVLSFPLLEDAPPQSEEEAEPPEQKLPLGDIVISLEKAREQAVQYGHSFEREVAFLCVHSVLHLLGYDHETGEEDEKQMFFKQEEILRILGIER